MSITLDEINQVLINTGSFIVHCAGYAKGIGFSTQEVGYLERISKVISEKPPISCSSVHVGDSADTHLTGQIGLILIPNHQCSISHASPQDAGTSVDDRNTAKLQKLTISLTDLKHAIENRVDGSYNELCLYNYDVHGIFYTRLPVEFSHNPTDEDLADDTGNGIVNPNQFNSIAINDMNSEGLPVYQFENGNFYLANFDGNKYVRSASLILVSDVLKISTKN